MTPMPIDCQSSLELLPLHVGGDLDPAESAPLVSHLAQCESCRAEEAAAQAARGLFFQVAGGDGAEAVDLWPDVSAALARDRAQGRSLHAPGLGDGDLWSGERTRAGAAGPSPLASALTGEARWGVGAAEGRGAAGGRDPGGRDAGNKAAASAFSTRRPSELSRRARRYSLAAAALTLVGSTVFFAALFEGAASSPRGSGFHSDPAVARPFVGSTMEGVTPVSEGRLSPAPGNANGPANSNATVPWGLSTSPGSGFASAEFAAAEFAAQDFAGPEIAAETDQAVRGAAPRDSGRLQPIRADQRLRVDSIWVPLRRADGGQGNLANDG